MMFNILKRSLFLTVCILLFFSANAQLLKPVKWDYSAKRNNANEAVLTLTAYIEKGWHLYSQHIPENGPVPTSFKFNKSADYELAGTVNEGKPEEVYDPNFQMNLKYFSDKAVFTQKIKFKKNTETKVSGTLEFMVCDNKQCLPPEDIEFTINVPAALVEQNTTTPTAVSIPNDTTHNSPAPDVLNSTKEEISQPETPVITEDTNSFIEKNTSAWSIFIQGFLAGFIALLTPCVFPMIPLTVSFFSRKNKKKGKTIYEASLYGISIILIYVALGFGVTKLLGGADSLNDLASNAFFNLFFFLILTIFGVSFLGAFEIQLPSSFVNKVDAKSEKGGFIGIFFMAFTLALVSFSCTGPIVGTLLVQAAHSNNYLGPLAGMTGFSLALALPFTLFAAFPALMHGLPKSGGWLNSVKVTLGFLELAFALKFLSNVDLAYHWHLLDRDIFLAIWIGIFFILGFYLLGFIKFSHDSDLRYISIPRFLFALSSWAFAIYMIPGLWGAPLKSISAFTPPLSTQEFKGGSHVSSAQTTTPKKYAGLFECPHDLNCFFDYDEGLAYAAKVNKPVMLDFTGWSCTNCRKMEASVWADPAVLKRLREDFVIISLYVDDKTELAESEKYTSPLTGKKIKTLGNKWSDLEASRFNINSQPLYVLLGKDGKVLNKPYQYDPDVQKFITFLDAGKMLYHQ